MLPVVYCDFGNDRKLENLDKISKCLKKQKLSAHIQIKIEKAE